MTARPDGLRSQRVVLSDWLVRRPAREAISSKPYLFTVQGGTAMLVLSRRVGEEIVIGGDIHVVVVRVRGNMVRLGISAPPVVRVDRQEVRQRREMRPCFANSRSSSNGLVAG